ncbi:trimeric intracellular cation channel family protein [Siccirubricoccus sp. G192]|uniref:trimeric intracellular cation channel family protein n=1 Tax=Siccirubricoccus sp. G192 TaxID=2849651 RepID=UPI001C2C871A|nr:TRIC cation channel family protein [Siccirubricoccus sp. G192]MBV1795814.1 TRIC cation channel family protein [Siccirubricoccus sp. G192]
MSGLESAALLVRALDLVGTFVFAISGAALGTQRGMDLFGVLVLGCVTAVVGGITRDVLIGAIPPASVASWHNLALALAAGLLTFRFSRLFDRLQQPVQFFDAAGLGVFAVAGTQKAVAFGINWPMAAVLGMISGIGGGMVRDMLAAQVPTVLRADIYAVAALAGALVVVAGSALGLPPTAVALAGVALCVFLRLMALYHGWRLPAAPSREP